MLFVESKLERLLQKQEKKKEDIARIRRGIELVRFKKYGVDFNTKGLSRKTFIRVPPLDITRFSRYERPLKNQIERKERYMRNYI